MSQNWTPPPPTGGAPATIPNNLVLAIISVFCCWPFAIPAIISATQVNSKVAAGDIAGAQESSNKAKKFAKIGIGVGVAVWLLTIICYVIFFVILAASSR